MTFVRSVKCEFIFSLRENRLGKIKMVAEGCVTAVTERTAVLKSGLREKWANKLSSRIKVQTKGNASVSTPPSAAHCIGPV